MSNPFAPVIAAAKQREDDAKAKAATAAAEAEAAMHLKVQERAIERLRHFGEGFLYAVAKKVVKPTWQSSYIELIQEYAEGLLLTTSVPKLPKIDARHAEQILQKFEFGLKLASERGFTIPDNTFYGQKLLAERAQRQSQSPTPSSIQQGWPEARQA